MRRAVFGNAAERGWRSGQVHKEGLVIQEFDFKGHVRVVMEYLFMYTESKLLPFPTFHRLQGH